MTIQDLKDLYFDQLQDLYSANNQALPVTTELGRAATDEELSEALVAGGNGISDGIDRIATICARHGIDPSGEHCKGMEGLVREAKAHAIEADIGDPDTRDAMVITQYQRLCHYGIAGYGCLVAFANRLGFDDDAASLEECLEQTRQGDRHMTEIATGGVNRAAA